MQGGHPQGRIRGEGANAANPDASIASTGNNGQGRESNQGNAAVNITWLVYDSSSSVTGEMDYIPGRSYLPIKNLGSKKNKIARYST